MKRFIASPCFSVKWLGFTCLLFSLRFATAQEATYKEKELQVTKQKTNDIDDATLRKQMRADGVSDPVITKLLAQRREWIKKNKNVFWTNARGIQNPIVNAPCNGLGVEGGWGAWSGSKGSNSSGPSNNISWGAASNPPAPANLYAITSGTGIDPNTPSAGNPSIPVVCPGFGNNSIVLNQNCTTGYLCEQLTYPLTVTAQDTNFVYAYAMVVENAGHPTSEQPFVEFDIYDSVGNVIPCSHQLYTGGPNIPGFYPVNGNGCGYSGDQYKPWTLVGVNLSAYIGHTLNVVIINADCDQGGHFAYSYWDFLCGTSSLVAGCTGVQTSICGPTDPNIAYTYQWYQNGTAMPPPQGTQQCINVIAQPGDTFYVHVSQPSTCDFSMRYVPASIQPDFTFNGQCNNVNFTDNTTLSPANTTITSWNWSFPGGTPAAATTQSVAVTYPAAGSYVATLTVTCSAGCSDVVTHTVTVAGPPVATFSNNSVCAGNTTQFTDSSVPGPGDPIATWSWTFTGGTPATSTAQNPTSTYPPGNYTASLTITSQNGCTAATTQSVTVYPQPVANFSPTTVCFGNATNFTDLSTGGGTSWNWAFGDGNTSTVQNPTNTYAAPGTYTTTLIVTGPGGCNSTFSLPDTVYPQPVAVFSAPTVCFGNPTPFTDQSTGGGTVWNWNFGDNNTSTLQNPVNTYSAAGTYTATVNVSAVGGCNSTANQVITVNPLPVANLSGNNVCFNNHNSFNDLSTGNNTISNWDWNFGDSNTSTNQNPTHTYSSAGSHTVTLIVTNNFGCKDTNTITVVVNPLPLASFSSTTVCFGNSTCFTDLSSIATGSVTGWSWNFGDPNSGSNISTVQQPCHVFSGPGPYSVLLTATSDSGCQSTTTLPVVINPLPVASFTNANVCLNTASNFTDNSQYFNPSDPINNWNWNFGDGSPNSNIVSPSHLYTTPGSYTVSLIVTTQLGCKDTFNDSVIVYNNPIAGFNFADSGCAPVCETMADISHTLSGTIASWEWSFPGGSPSQSNSSAPSVCWNTPGTYNVQQIVTTNFGCKDTLLQSQYIHVFAYPAADFCIDPPQNSVNTPVFTFCKQWSNDVVHWVWNFGDNSPNDSMNNPAPVHSYSATSTNNDYYTYNVCLSVQNQHGCWDSICKTVELIPEFEFYIPNCFTPNTDGTNEFFFGKGRGIKDYNIWIFDRWGNMIWSCNYDGSNVAWDDTGKDGMPSACKWDGVVQGSGSSNVVQEDVYVWKVKLTDIFNNKHNYIGHVSVVK